MKAAFSLQLEGFSEALNEAPVDATCVRYLKYCLICASVMLLPHSTVATR